MRHSWQSMRNSPGFNVEDLRTQSRGKRLDVDRRHLRRGVGLLAFLGRKGVGSLFGPKEGGVRHSWTGRPVVFFDMIEAADGTARRAVSLLAYLRRRAGRGGERGLRRDRRHSLRGALRVSSTARGKTP